MQSYLNLFGGLGNAQPCAGFLQLLNIKGPLGHVHGGPINHFVSVKGP